MPSTRSCCCCCWRHVVYHAQPLCNLMTKDAPQLDPTRMFTSSLWLNYYYHVLILKLWINFHTCFRQLGTIDPLLLQRSADVVFSECFLVLCDAIVAVLCRSCIRMKWFIFKWLIFNFHQLTYYSNPFDLVLHSCITAPRDQSASQTYLSETIRIRMMHVFRSRKSVQLRSLMFTLSNLPLYYLSHVPWDRL